MFERIRWCLVLALVLPMAVSGCDTSRHSSRPPLSDNSRFMDMWNTYSHCYRSEDLDAMHADAQRLNHAVGATTTIADPVPPESIELVPLGPAVRLSVDPAAMAAACALRAGQVAQGTGHRNLAREMFQTVITNFPQPPYRYYVAQARLGLDRLDTTSPATFSGYTIPGGPT